MSRAVQWSLFPEYVPAVDLGRVPPPRQLEARKPAIAPVDGRPVPVGLSHLCQFCGAAPGIPCLWVARSWPDTWVHESRLTKLHPEARAIAERQGWVAVLLELLERAPIRAQQTWRAAVAAALPLEATSAAQRQGLAGAVQELVSLGVAELNDGVLKLRRP